MSEKCRSAILTAIVTAALPIALAAYGAQQPQHEGGAHHHPEAAKLKNPVAANAESIAAGQKVYAKNCASCHGETGKGDGKMGAQMNPPPANLTDADWKHGSSDGEIFTVVRDGIKGSPMKAFKSKMTEQELWQVVTYVHSLGPSRS